MQETQGADGTQSTADGHSTSVDDTSKPQTVKYETYDKAMASLSKAKQEAQDLKKQLDEIREKEMLSQGKYQELLAEREKELKDIKDSLLREKTEKFVAEAKSVMTDIANRLGAFSADDIHKNINLKDVTTVDGKIDPKLIEAKVGELKQSKSYLFKASSVKVVDGTPQTTVDGTVRFDKLDGDKLAALYRQRALGK